MARKFRLGLLFRNEFNQKELDFIKSLLRPHAEQDATIFNSSHETDGTEQMTADDIFEELIPESPTKNLGDTILQKAMEYDVLDNTIIAIIVNLNKLRISDDTIVELINFIIKKETIEDRKKLLLELVATLNPCSRINSICAQAIITLVDQESQNDIIETTVKRFINLLQQIGYKSIGEILDTTNLDGLTPLMAAVENNYLNLVKKMFEFNPSLLIQNNSEQNALILAIEYGNQEIIELLLQKAIQQKSLVSTFFLAIKNDYRKTVEYIINIKKHKCLLGTKQADDNGKTAVMIAYENKHEELANFLKKKMSKKQKNITDNSRNRLNYYKYKYELFQSASEYELFKEKHGRFNLLNLINSEPTSDKKIFSDYLETIKDPNYECKGVHIISKILALPHKSDDAYKAIKALLEKGANPNVLDEFRCTPLIRAVEQQNLSLVKLLIEHGAKVNLEDAVNSALDTFECAYTRKTKELKSYLSKIVGKKTDIDKIGEILLEQEEKEKDGTTQEAETQVGQNRDATFIMLDGQQVRTIGQESLTDDQMLTFFGQPGSSSMNDPESDNESDSEFEDAKEPKKESDNEFEDAKTPEEIQYEKILEEIYGSIRRVNATLKHNVLDTMEEEIKDISLISEKDLEVITEEQSELQELITLAKLISESVVTSLENTPNSSQHTSIKLSDGSTRSILEHHNKLLENIKKKEEMINRLKIGSKIAQAILNPVKSVFDIFEKIFETGIDKEEDKIGKKKDEMIKELKTALETAQEKLNKSKEKIQQYKLNGAELHRKLTKITVGQAQQPPRRKNPEVGTEFATEVVGEITEKVIKELQEESQKVDKQKGSGITKQPISEESMKVEDQQPGSGQPVVDLNATVGYGEIPNREPDDQGTTQACHNNRNNRNKRTPLSSVDFGEKVPTPPQSPTPSSGSSSFAIQVDPTQPVFALDVKFPSIDVQKKQIIGSFDKDAITQVNELSSTISWMHSCLERTQEALKNIKTDIKLSLPTFGIEAKEIQTTEDGITKIIQESYAVYGSFYALLNQIRREKGSTTPSLSDKYSEGLTINSVESITNFLKDLTEGMFQHTKTVLTSYSLKGAGTMRMQGISWKDEDKNFYTEFAGTIQGIYREEKRIRRLTETEKQEERNPTEKIQVEVIPEVRTVVQYTGESSQATQVQPGSIQQDVAEDQSMEQKTGAGSGEQERNKLVASILLMTSSLDKVAEALGESEQKAREAALDEEIALVDGFGVAIGDVDLGIEKSEIPDTLENARKACDDRLGKISESLGEKLTSGIAKLKKPAEAIIAIVNGTSEVGGTTPNHEDALNLKKEFENFKKALEGIKDELGKAIEFTPIKKGEEVVLPACVGTTREKAKQKNPEVDTALTALAVKSLVNGVIKKAIVAEEARLEAEAATKIQAAWRGKKGREEAEAKRKAREEAETLSAMVDMFDKAEEEARLEAKKEAEEKAAAEAKRKAREEAETLSAMVDMFDKAEEEAAKQCIVDEMIDDVFNQKLAEEKATLKAEEKRLEAIAAIPLPEDKTPIVHKVETLHDLISSLIKVKNTKRDYDQDVIILDKAYTGAKDDYKPGEVGVHIMSQVKSSDVSMTKEGKTLNIREDEFVQYTQNISVLDDDGKEILVSAAIHGKLGEDRVTVKTEDGRVLVYGQNGERKEDQEVEVSETVLLTDKGDKTESLIQINEQKDDKQKPKTLEPNQFVYERIENGDKIIQSVHIDFDEKAAEGKDKLYTDRYFYVDLCDNAHTLLKVCFDPYAKDYGDDEIIIEGLYKNDKAGENFKKVKLNKESLTSDQFKSLVEALENSRRQLHLIGTRKADVAEKAEEMKGIILDTKDLIAEVKKLAKGQGVEIGNTTPEPESQTKTKQLPL